MHPHVLEVSYDVKAQFLKKCRNFLHEIEFFNVCLRKLTPNSYLNYSGVVAA